MTRAALFVPVCTTPVNAWLNTQEKLRPLSVLQPTRPRHIDLKSGRCPGSLHREDTSAPRASTCLLAVLTAWSGRSQLGHLLF